jgi:hypothetical protein
MVDIQDQDTPLSIISVLYLYMRLTVVHFIQLVDDHFTETVDKHHWEKKLLSKYKVEGPEISYPISSRKPRIHTISHSVASVVDHVL